MKVIEVWGETKPVDCSFDVFLYVGGRVGHSAFGAGDVKATLGGHYIAIGYETSQ